MTKINYDKFMWDENNLPKRITNNDLKCKDCAYRIQSTARCTKYEEQKPLAIIRGGECELYKPLAIKD